MLDSVQLSRLKWSSRRGMLENDLVLSTFFDRHAGELDAVRADGLKALLELADGDLWDLIVNRADLGASAGPGAQAVLDMLRNCQAAHQTA